MDGEGNGKDKEKRGRGGRGMYDDKTGGKKEEEGGESWRGLRRAERFKTEGESFNRGRHVHKRQYWGLAFPSSPPKYVINSFPSLS